MNFVAIDFETTGYENGGTNDPLQLGVAVVRHAEIIETYDFRFNPGDFQARFEEWAPILIGQKLVAHNIACERTILTRTAPLTKWGPWTDTMKVAKSRFPKLDSYALGDLCKLFECTPQIDGRTWHDGLYDAVACAMLAMRLAF